MIFIPTVKSHFLSDAMIIFGCTLHLHHVNIMKESHGDWLAVEHNSTVANDLKQKYGEKDLSSNP